jgi:hypothetical protein
MKTWLILIVLTLAIVDCYSACPIPTGSCQVNNGGCGDCDCQPNQYGVATWCNEHIHPDHCPKPKGSCHDNNGGCKKCRCQSDVYGMAMWCTLGYE